MADLASAIEKAEEFFAQYDPTVYGLAERGSVDTKEVRLLRSLLAAAREADGELLFLHQYAFGIAHNPECQGDPAYLCCRCRAEKAEAALAEERERGRELLSIREEQCALMGAEMEQMRAALAEYLSGPCGDCLGYETQIGALEAALAEERRRREEAERYCPSCGGNGWVAEGDEQIGCVSCNGTGDDCSAQPARCPVDKSNPLRRFVRHHERCRIWEIGAPSCSCGLLSVLGMARPSDLDTAAQPSAIPCPVDHSTCSRCNCDTSEDQQVFVLCDGCYGATTRPAQPAPMPDAKAKAAFLEAQDSLAVAVWSQPNHTLHISDGDKLSLPIPFEIVSYYDPARVRTTLEVRAISAAPKAEGKGGA